MNNDNISDKQKLQNLISSGSAHEAESLCKKLLTYHDQDLELYTALFQLQLTLHKIEDADSTRKLINKGFILSPDNHNFISWAFINNGRSDIAVDQYRIAILEHPEIESLYTSAAGLLIHLRNYTKAIQLLKSGIGVLAPSSQVHLMLGAAYQSLQSLEPAHENYKISFELSNDNLDAAIGLANIHYLKRAYKEAADIINPIIENNPNYPVSAAILYSQLASAIDQQDQAIKTVTATLQNHKMHARQRSMLHFSLGRLNDELCEYQKAFVNYKKANALDSQQYDRIQTEKHFNKIIGVFNKEFITRCKLYDLSGKRHIFIVGMPRSGTSLTEQIISSHPDVYGAGELSILHRLVKTLPAYHNMDKDFPEFVTSIDSGIMDEIASSYQKHIDSLDSEHTFVTDKMPDNFLYLGLINIIFPTATIIHCTRDPYDTCLSCYFQQFSGHYPYAYQLDNLGHYYNLYSEMMSHWRDNLITPMFELNYEALVADKESAIRKLLKHCKLDWHEDCFEPNKSSRAVTTASTQQIGKNLYKTSVDRWRNYEPYLEPLIRVLDSKS